MRTFETTGPVRATVENACGEVVVDTTDAPTTEVEVTPLRDDERSREAAANTLVELRPRGERSDLVVEVPHRGGGSFFGREPQVRVAVRLPHGSDLRVTTASADVRANGRFGEVRGKTASGDVSVGQAERVRVESASGDLRVDEVDGDADLKSVSGDVSAGRIGGTLSGTVVSGSLRVDSVERGGSANAVSGDVDLGSVREGEVALRTVSGDVTIGVREGSRVHVDVTTVSGDLRSDLDLSDEPGSAGDGPLVEIRGRTVSGDLRVRRGRGTTAPSMA
ncbi:MAG TPA: DUF4097 family beta strand repeat-containing protein [Mycobacteriales bacterium]|jgi:hypothetical protein|nr:DUF4097 family beta strand repeat-containing protein [Mycobacteriales bacterium]